MNILFAIISQFSRQTCREVRRRLRSQLSVCLLLALPLIAASCAKNNGDAGGSNHPPVTAQQKIAACNAQMATKFEDFRHKQNQWYIDHGAPAPLDADQSFFLPGPSGRVDIVVHGFTSSPRYMSDLAHSLANTGDTVIVPLLTGYGVDGKTANLSTADDWRASYEAAMAIGQSCGTSVNVIAHSLGAAIATDELVNRHQTGVNRLVLLTPYYRVANQQIAFLGSAAAGKLAVIDMPLLRSLVPGIEPYDWLPLERPLPGDPEPYLPLTAMKEVVDLQPLFAPNGAAPVIPAALKSPVPVLLVTSQNDNVIDAGYAVEYASAVFDKVMQITFAKELGIGHSIEDARDNIQFAPMSVQIVDFLSVDKSG